MVSNPDFFARCSRGCLLAALAALAACSTGPSGNSAEEAAAGSMAARSSAAARPKPRQPAPQAGTAALPANDAALRLLAYADRVRLMPPAELGQEVARLGDMSAPTEQLQLSLVLSQLRQLPELVRAQELLARVLGNGDAEAQALHPLARLLAARYGEQRRLEEQLDRQSQQLREVQRRLEALKAIERSLTSRPPAAASSSPLPAPANRGRATAP